MIVLHLTGRSDHGGGPEHLLHLVQASRGWIEPWIACPREGVYWQRYAAVVGADRLIPIPHRRVDPEGVMRLSAAVRRIRPQLIHSHGMAAGVLGRLVARHTATPSVHTFHGIPLTISAKHLLYRLAERWLAPWTDLGIAVSPGEAEVVLRRYPSYAQRIQVVSNGICVDGPEPLPRTAVGPLTIAMFARANQQKRPELVVAIADHLRCAGIDDVRFRLYGEGLAEATWIRRAVQGGLPITARPPTDDPRAVLDHADLYLSTSRWEGMPLALIEAFRSGAVVVASDVVGNRDVVEHDRNGLLFPDGDALAAARAIIALRADRQRRARLRQQAWDDCRERHTRELMALRVLECYRTVLRRRGQLVGAPT